MQANRSRGQRVTGDASALLTHQTSQSAHTVLNPRTVFHPISITPSPDNSARCLSQKEKKYRPFQSNYNFPSLLQPLLQLHYSSSFNLQQNDGNAPPYLIEKPTRYCAEWQSNLVDPSHCHISILMNGIPQLSFIHIVAIDKPPSNSLHILAAAAELANAWKDPSTTAPSNCKESPLPAQPKVDEAVSLEEMFLVVYTNDPVAAYNRFKSRVSR